MRDIGGASLRIINLDFGPSEGGDVDESRREELQRLLIGDIIIA